MTEQNSVLLDDATHAQVALLARAWGISEGKAVSRLVNHFQQAPTAPSTVPDAAAVPDQAVPVHALYSGRRIAGYYTPATRGLSITDGPGAGHYKTPSGAAAAVLQALNPGVNPNRNGWGFWVVNETGEFLQSLRHR